MTGVRTNGQRFAVVAALASIAIAFASADVEADEASRTTSDGGRSAPAAAGEVLPADIEDVEHMCALLTACEKLPFPARLVPKDFVGCTRALYAELASASALSFSITLRECGLRASSCGELRTCALRGARADVCAGRGKASAIEMCDVDGRAITCTNERVSLVRDCPRGGEQCVVRDGHAVCALGVCDKDSPATCSPSGTRVLECKQGKLLSLDCGAFGLKCLASSEGPKCATPSAACKEGTTRCEGAHAVTCFHGHEVRIDCGSRGLTCGPRNVATEAGVSGAPVGACTSVVPPSGACDPAAPPRCDGATLRWCAWGQPRGYLCKSVGLQRCISDANGARCAP